MNISVNDGPRDIPYNEKGLQIWEEMYACLEMGYSKGNLNNANMCLYHFLATFQYVEKHFSIAEDKDNMIRETIVFMKEKIGCKFKVEDFSVRYKLSVSHFSSMFHRSTGTSPMEYFIQLKIQKTCQLLYTKSITIKEIAFSLGYDDPYYFSRLFKKMMGISPEQYRQTRNLRS
ncbi:helix-turn-helix domain-containing protein [Pedobacter lusitanus]|uniref:helix-turn-helix domain-containing protein n=1 Tax=Pedobacter lusitanus TaxID=1503925 RepID=UPI000AC83D16